MLPLPSQAVWYGERDNTRNREILTARMHRFNCLLISFINVLINEHGKGNRRMSVDLVLIHSNCVNDIKSSIN